MFFEKKYATKVERQFSVEYTLLGSLFWEVVVQEGRMVRMKNRDRKENKKNRSHLEVKMTPALEYILKETGLEPQMFDCRRIID